MNNILIEEVLFIEEDEYQKMKKELNKNNDYFCLKEINHYLAQSIKQNENHIFIEKNIK